jgi:hypothetical protein
MVKKSAMKPLTKKILSALAVAVFGFILLNIIFLFDALFQGLITAFARLFTPLDVNMKLYWFPPTKHILFAIIIWLIALPIFKSKLSTIYKAIYFVAPLAVTFATIGMFFYPWPIVVYSLGSLFFLGVLCYLYKTKQPWIYYYTLILISIAMLLVNLLGVEI